MSNYFARVKDSLSRHDAQKAGQHRRRPPQRQLSPVTAHVARQAPNRCFASAIPTNHPEPVADWPNPWSLERDVEYRLECDPLKEQYGDKYDVEEAEYGTDRQFETPN